MYILLTPIIVFLKEIRCCFRFLFLQDFIFLCGVRLLLKPSGLWTSYFKSKYNLTIIVTVSQRTAFDEWRPDNRITYAICERLEGVYEKTGTVNNQLDLIMYNALQIWWVQKFYYTPSHSLIQGKFQFTRFSPSLSLVLNLFPSVSLSPSLSYALFLQPSVSLSIHWTQLFS